MFIFDSAKLLATRETKGWSREQLAAAADCSFGSVIAYEHGHRAPSRTTLLRLASALDVSPSELVRPDPTFVDLEAARAYLRAVVPAEEPIEVEDPAVLDQAASVVASGGAP
jgi:transcriptional regulator with XRE-family HTH domain